MKTNNLAESRPAGLTELGSSIVYAKLAEIRLTSGTLSKISNIVDSLISSSGNGLYWISCPENQIVLGQNSTSSLVSTFVYYQIRSNLSNWQASKVMSGTNRPYSENYSLSDSTTSSVVISKGFFLEIVGSEFRFKYVTTSNIEFVCGSLLSVSGIGQQIVLTNAMYVAWKAIPYKIIHPVFDMTIFDV